MPGALRGLAIGLTLSALNFVGAVVTLLALGGLGDWTHTQFIGLFGLLELATGIVFIIGPNIWRLPVAVAELEPGTRVRLAVSTVLIPHWAGGVKSVAGLGLVGWAAIHEGSGWGSLSLTLVVADLCAVAVALSLLVARAGCAWPDVDVFQISIERPRRRPKKLPGMSIGGSLVQGLLNTLIFPSVTLLEPTVLYSPGLSPSPGFQAVAGVIALLVSLAALVAWADRLAWRAPVRQQREAEEAFTEG